MDRPAKRIDGHDGLVERQDALSRLQQDMLADMVLGGDCAVVLERLKSRVEAAFDGVALGYLLFDPLHRRVTSSRERQGALPAGGPAIRTAGTGDIDALKTAPAIASPGGGHQALRRIRRSLAQCSESLPVHDGNGQLIGVVYLECSGSRVCPPLRARLLEVCVHAIEVLLRRDGHERELRRMANYDALTGAANRTLFRDRLTSALEAASREHASLSVMFIDLDHFKSINDNYGHETGDEVLRRFAGAVEDALPHRHVLARMGGDEFVLLIDESLSPVDFDALGRRLVQAVNGSYRIAARDVAVSASAGVSVYPRDGASAEQLLRAADNALLAAKAGGRGSHRMAASPASACAWPAAEFVPGTAARIKDRCERRGSSWNLADIGSRADPLVARVDSGGGRARRRRPGREVAV